MAMPPVNLRMRDRTLRLLFHGILIFMVCQSTAKTMKIGSLKYFWPYGILEN